MLKEMKMVDKMENIRKTPIVIDLVGAIASVILIIGTLDVSHRNLYPFISAQQKYILSIESAILVICVVEFLVELVTLHLHTPKSAQYSARLRFLVRVVGYCVGFLSVVSILASNAALGISLGAIAGAVLVFSTQNITSNVLDAVFLHNSRLVRIGEEITVGLTKGTISDITITHTIISSDDEVVFIPNTVMISSTIRRKKRNLDKMAGANKW